MGQPRVVQDGGFSIKYALCTSHIARIKYGRNTAIKTANLYHHDFQIFRDYHGNQVIWNRIDPINKAYNVQTSDTSSRYIS